MSYHQLTLEERYIISFMMKRKCTKGEIAAATGRHISTIYREVGRNYARHDGWYRAWIADDYARGRRHKSPRGCRFSEEQWAKVRELIERKHSPEQAAAEIKELENFSISHETIYKYVYQDRRHGGKLYEQLRRRPKKRKKRGAKYLPRAVFADRKNISERPEAAERRSRIGHWEGDTVYGADRHHSLVTLVERKTGQAIIKKIKARTIEETNRAVIEAIREHPWKFRTITFDNGFEFMGYKGIEEKTRVRCYFANSYHSWERGSVENLNGLIRQYLPKGMCLRNVTQSDCDRIAEELNSRPRKRHGFKTPKELFYAYN